MKLVQSTDALRAEVGQARARGARIGFVPTMGNLHAGHLALVDEARRRADYVVVSIYVNPSQFGPGEDYAAYPRTPDEDVEALARAKVDVAFLPGDREIYPRGVETHTRVEVPGISELLCGASRPGHFRGVATVVNRLFNLVAPDVAVFGKKDYQQLLVIRRMTADLGLPVEIVGAETVREPDGLALSSRNGYLTPSERASAPALHRALADAIERMRSGTARAAAERDAALSLRGAGFEPEYVSVRRRDDLAEPVAGDRRLVILAAARLGKTRLIDNLEFDI